MKLSRFSKQIIAVACSIAMVVAGLVFVPSADTKADAPDWSTIDYLGDGAGGGTYTNKYKFYAENLREWFLTLYKVLFGTESGPRMGSFVSLYGIGNTVKLIEERLR